MSIRLMRRLVAGAVAVCALVVTGCGGGSADEAPPPPAGFGTIAGLAVSSTDSSPLAGVTVSAGGISTTTGADGAFTLDDVPAGARVVVTLSAPDHIDGLVQVAVAADATSRVSARLVSAGNAVVIDAGSGGTATAPGSVAAVVLQANSLVVESTGADATGDVSVRVTPIDPAADPLNMPGSYRSSDDRDIESFGAVKYSLEDANGNPLNLKPGNTATIRIPLASRSSTPPASVPLFYLDETSGQWVQEGSATLMGSAPNQYYEGSVSHFTFWNADRVQETIYVHGCVNDAAGSPVRNAQVTSAGLDYSGAAHDDTDADGRFSVAMRINSRAAIFADAGAVTNTVEAGPSATDITLSQCLVLGTEVAPPTIVSPPMSTTRAEGFPAMFQVVASGGRPLTYQWQRDGVDIPDATSAWLVVWGVTEADDGAQFTVVVSNAHGSATSSAATLTVSANDLDEQVELMRLLTLVFDFYDAAAVPTSVVADDEFVFQNPASACQSGSASGSFNGGAIPVGQDLPPSGSVAATLNDCMLDSFSTYTGAGSLNFNFTNLYPLSGSATASVTNVRVRRLEGGVPGGEVLSDVTANGSGSVVFGGSVSGALTTSTITITPGSGATLRNELSGNVATFASGSVAVRNVTTPDAQFGERTTQMRFTYNDLRLSVAGVSYAANGFYELNFGSNSSITSGSGEVLLTSNSVTVGRLYATNDGVFAEVNGTVQPFAIRRSAIGIR